jgi:signal transduction histidine kinase
VLDQLAPSDWFVLVAPRAATGLEVSNALLLFFAALVLLLFPDEGLRLRLRWVAMGLCVLGLGGLGYGYLVPTAEWFDHVSVTMYGSILTRTLGGLAIAVGMVLPRPPALSRRLAMAYVAVSLVLGAVEALGADGLPGLAAFNRFEEPAAQDASFPNGLTVWHWALSAVPLALTIAAAVGVAWYASDRPIGGWLAAAIVLLASAELLTMFWPSTYSPILTAATVMRLAFTAVVAVGAVHALYRVAAEREALLATQRTALARLIELEQLRADFGAMLAHELASPVAAIRGHTAMLASGALASAAQIDLGAEIRAETALLSTLIGDVRTAAAVERADFALQPIPVRLSLLLADAVAFARTLPGDHPVECDLAVRERVVADPERIAQVQRNLLVNAAKHTPPGTPIALRTERRGSRMRVMVADQGPGIAPEEAAWIFEKFGRGRDAQGGRVPGAGLGLYLARRIVRTHGSELSLEPTPDGGATFCFELELAP